MLAQETSRGARPSSNAAAKLIQADDQIAHMLRLMQRMIGTPIRIACTPSPRLAAVEIDPFHLDQILLNPCVNARDAIPEGGNLLIGKEVV